MFAEKADTEQKIIDLCKKYLKHKGIDTDAPLVNHFKPQEPKIIHVGINDITSVYAAVGMAVNPSEMLMEIVDNKELHIELSVFEKDILKVKENQLIKFTVPEASKEIFEGEVHLIGKSIEGTDRTTNVHGHLDEKVKQKLLTGMFIEANIVVDRKKGYAVPKDALGKENDKYFVLLFHHEDGKGIHFTKVPVVVGASSDDFEEIAVDGKIKPDSKVLLKGVFDLIN